MKHAALSVGFTIFCIFATAQQPSTKREDLVLLEYWGINEWIDQTVLWGVPKGQILALPKHGSDTPLRLNISSLIDTAKADLESKKSLNLDSTFQVFVPSEYNWTFCRITFSEIDLGHGEENLYSWTPNPSGRWVAKLEFRGELKDKREKMLDMRDLRDPIAHVFMLEDGQIIPQTMRSPTDGERKHLKYIQSELKSESTELVAEVRKLIELLKGRLSSDGAPKR